MVWLCLRLFTWLFVCAFVRSLGSLIVCLFVCRLFVWLVGCLFVRVCL